jgi:hypothetical protein
MGDEFQVAVLLPEELPGDIGVPEGEFDLPVVIQDW